MELGKYPAFPSQSQQALVRTQGPLATLAQEGGHRRRRRNPVPATRLRLRDPCASTLRPSSRSEAEAGSAGRTPPQPSSSGEDPGGRGGSGRNFTTGRRWKMSEADTTKDVEGGGGGFLLVEEVF